MKIAFIRPNMHNFFSKDAIQPLAFAILKSLTPNNIETELYDNRIEKINYNTNADLIAISVETYTAKSAYKISKEFKKRNKTVIMGGFHPTFLPKEALKFCDSVVLGEAESVWKKIIQDFNNNNLKNIYIGDNNYNIENIFFDESIFKGKKYAPIMPIQFSRGCKYNCEFCSINSFSKNTVKYRCVKKVIDEIHRKKPKYLFIIDDNIYSNKDKMKQLLKSLIPLKVKWGCQISIDITKDENLLDLMAESGCITTFIGFESLNENNIKQMNKNMNIDNFNYEYKINKIRKRGIMIYGSFVMGYDDDKFESFEKTVNFTIKNKFFLANFNPLTPMPGTQLYTRLKNENRLIYKNWWIDNNFKYGKSVFYPKNMTPQQLEDGCYYARKKFNSYFSIFKRSLDFKSNLANINNFFIYFGINMISRKEIHKKQGKKLG